MTSLLHQKWNDLKDQIEQLRPLVEANPNIIMKIRKLKNEASVIRFAIEDSELFGYSNDEVVERMQEHREGYKKLWNY